MTKLLVKSRIPYLAQVGAIRADCISGCGNGPDVCAVSQRCWARKIAYDNADKAFVAGYNHMARMQGLPESPLTEDAKKVMNSCHVDVFQPEFHPEVLDAIGRLRKPKVIAMNFGGDAWSNGVDPEWRKAMFATEEQFNQHIYVHLTKCTGSLSYEEIHGTRIAAWVGASITKRKELLRLTNLYYNVACVRRWLSFEPLLEAIPIKALALSSGRIQWVVIGGQSDSKHVLRPEEPGGIQATWAQTIIDAAYDAQIPLFLKNVGHIYRELVNPRTGMKMKNPRELRELPEEWEALK